MDASSAPLLEFDRDDPEFTLGVEIGMLWQRLQLEDLPLTAVVHGENAEMALRVAEAKGLVLRVLDLGDWLGVCYTEGNNP